MNSGFADSGHSVDVSRDVLLHLPKVELHVHLEGAISAATLLTLASRHGVSLPGRTEAELASWLQFRDFPHFAQVYQTISRCIQTLEDLEMLTYDFLREQARQHIWHTEFTFTAWTHFWNWGLPYQEQFAALHQARARAERDFGVKSLIIVDIPRELASAQQGVVVAEQALLARRYGVAALGLGGYEVDNPVAVHRNAFDLARQEGLPCVLHAGETEGPASIWEALEIGHSIRIGHGVRCLEDNALVEHLRRHRIPLEVCPTSNVCLRVVDEYSLHPLPELIERGLYVTLNSDDPALFGTSLVEEYYKSHQLLGLSVETLGQLSRNALSASLLPLAHRQELQTRYFQR
ncbi:MAG: adenosine deaminase [Hymenobacter sp.]|nr:adenosine deaminase [Hymenobacter sp.]